MAMWPDYWKGPASLPGGKHQSSVCMDDCPCNFGSEEDCSRSRNKRRLLIVVPLPFRKERDIPGVQQGRPEVELDGLV